MRERRHRIPLPLSDSACYHTAMNTRYPPSRRRRFLWAPIFIALLAIAYQYLSSEQYTNPETGRTARVALSPSQEATLGLQGFREVLSQSRVVSSGPEVAMVNRVAQRLIAVVDTGQQRFNWDVRVLESDQANAFCLPGGKIAVYTGILPIAATDDGLAAVMGHEIAHATARHGAQRLLQQQMTQTALMGVDASTAQMDTQERRNILGLLGAGVQFGVVLPFSRDDENEADEIGLRYLLRAGYDPEAAVAFWQRMEQAGGAHPPEWASTHPANESRISNLKRLIQEYRQNGTVGGRPLK